MWLPFDLSAVSTVFSSLILLALFYSYKMTTNWIRNNLGVLRGEGEAAPIEPMFGEYQLLGDSILVRFASKILHQTDRYINGSRTIGYCVSGQRIDELRQRVKLNKYPLTRNVMVLIGTNDVLCGGEIKAMVRHFHRLLRLLRTCNKILILTLPPIPKLSVSFYHWTLVRQYNDFLKSLVKADDRIVVADICPLYIKCQFLLEYNVVQIPCVRKRMKRRRVVKIEKSSTEDVDSDCNTTTTETNLSLESTVPSSEGSPVTPTATKTTRNKRICVTPTRKILPTGRLFLRSIKELTQQKEEKPKPEKSEKRSQPVVKQRRLVSVVSSTDPWSVESCGDTDTEVSGHVYLSQNETCFEDVSDVEDKVTERRRGQSDFGKYIDSMNNNLDGGKKKEKKEKPGSDSEASMTSATSVTSVEVQQKRQITPYVDRRFIHMLRQNGNDIMGRNRFTSPTNIYNSIASPIERSSPQRYGHAQPPPTPPPLPPSKFSPYSGRRAVSLHGLGERDRSIMELSAELCHLEYYELVYDSNNRMDMIHLNYRGLDKLSYFLKTYGFIVT